MVNVMKRLIPLFLVVFLIPQVALAAWWNPFSWGIFKKIDPQTQVLEDRVKELEKKLEEVSATPIKSQQAEEKENQANVQEALRAKAAQDALIIKQKAEEQRKIEEQKKVEEQARINALKNTPQAVPTGATLCNGKYYSSCPMDTYLSCPLNGGAAICRKTPPSSATEIATAKREVVNYIIDYKYQLYLTDIHITAAALIDIYDNLSNTKYGDKFKSTKTQQEAVEFANGFLIDVGEKITD